MDKKQSQDIIKDTFQKSFNKQQFMFFTKNLLNKYDESKAFHARGYVKDSFSEFVQTYERIATYTDPENNKIDILIVYLQKETSIERARTAQRNFVSSYLKQRDQKDAALVAFISPNNQDWRFSFVKMEYTFDSNKGKVKEEFTPAKRYSYLVGPNENSHTAQSRLVTILQDDIHNPTLAQVEDAFSVEKVTKEFFEQYKDLFLQTKEYLDNILTKDSIVNNDFTSKNIKTEDFAKKLMGQIVFLYFLQKKGWFGVARDAKWGTGPKNFLRKLFRKDIIEYNNFFNDVLEHLFYEALASKRQNDYYGHLDCRIPFLNGGLFDPIFNYDWINTNIYLPDSLFSNKIQTKTGDIGTGIFDVFDRFNFTVQEDEPLEKEVAIDPEMLGKVFENLLNVIERKSKGTYYTPREIVHYMCEESLVNYLETSLEGIVKRENLETLIKKGELIIEHEIESLDKNEDPEYKGNYQYRLPEDIRENAKLIDEKLLNIKVCDPAIGSGAFPVGMMNEIVQARQILTTYLDDKTHRTVYEFKRHAIQSSIHGVDIDPGAVEIAKLRLWLSLIVEEDNIANIKPLPNLDYKIMQGNSLIEEYEGIKLFNESFIETDDNKNKEIDNLKNKQSELQREYFSLYKDKTKFYEFKIVDSELSSIKKQLEKMKTENSDKNIQKELFKTVSEAKEKAEQLQKLQDMFFNESDKETKDILKNDIERVTWELIISTLKEQNRMDKVKEIDRLRYSNTKPFFLWNLNFADVFKERGGFDIVIANPPYKIITTNNTSTEEYKYYTNNFDVITLSNSKNLFTLFIERSIKLLSIHGILTFIVPEGLFKTRSYKNCVNLMNSNGSVNSLVTFSTYVFENAITGNLIFLFERNGQKVTSSFLFNNEYKLFVNNVKPNPIILKIQNNSILLKDIAILFKGMVVKDRNDVISEVRKDNKNIFLLGKNISKWKIKSKYYTDYDKLEIIGGTKKLIKYNKVPRILIRRTGENLCCTFLEYLALTESTLYSAWSINKNISNKFLLGLLNSKLLNYYNKSLNITNQQGFPQILMTDLENLPLKQIPLLEQKEIINNVDKILKTAAETNVLSNSSEINEIKELEKENDQIVYRLYSLTKEEIKIVEES